MIPTSLRRLLIRAVDGLRVTIFAGKNLRRRFPFLGEFHDRVIGLLMPKFIKYQGHIIYLDTMDSLGLLRNASFEEQESEVIKKFVKKGDAVFDLGANIGFHTLTLAKNVGKLGKVFSFEPCPETFSLLQKNVKANGYDNIVLIPKAVSEKSGHAKMHVEDEDGNFLESVAYNLREGGNFFTSKWFPWMNFLATAT